jgi:hypothetical protein
VSRWIMLDAESQPPAVPRAIRADTLPLAVVIVGRPLAIVAALRAASISHCPQSGLPERAAIPLHHRLCGFGFARPQAPIPPTGPGPASLLPQSKFSCHKTYTGCECSPRIHCRRVGEMVSDLLDMDCGLEGKTLSNMTNVEVENPFVNTGEIARCRMR